jgi:hypothetical protein
VSIVGQEVVVLQAPGKPDARVVTEHHQRGDRVWIEHHWSCGAKNGTASSKMDARRQALEALEAQVA